MILTKDVNIAILVIYLKFLLPHNGTENGFDALFGGTIIKFSTQGDCVSTETPKSAPDPIFVSL